MNKYMVTIELVVKAEDGHFAWLKANEICQKHLGGSATIRAVSCVPLPDPENWIIKQQTY